jgi:outer membrane protein assembly factor BamB
MGLGVALGAAHAQTDGAARWPSGFSTLSTSSAGNIVSSPTVGPDGTIYIGVEVGTSSSTSASGRVFAINPNGTQKWVFTAPDWVDSTPAVATDGTVYFGCWNGVLYALAADGTKRWEYKAGSFIASSPALGPDGTIYVGVGSNLVAVNSNGTLKWVFPAADWIDSSPAVGPDGTIYVGSWDNNLYAVRPDGAEKWRYTTDDNIVNSPAIAADGTIYVGSRDVRLYALNANGTLKWSYDSADTIESAPALAADGTIYLTTTGGRLIALSRDGAERWRYPAASATALNAIYSSPAVRADGSVIFGSSNNAIYAVRADGSLLWQTALGDWSDSSPLVTNDGTIYIGCSDKKLYSLASTAGAQVTDWAQFRRDPRRNGWEPLGAVANTTGRLTNLAVRTFAGAGDSTLIVGFVVGGGSGSRSLLVRGVGPTLTNFGVTGVLTNPRIAAYAGSSVMAENDDWRTAANWSTIASTATAVGAFPLAENSLDAALFNTFPARPYTVHVAGSGGGTGIALMEAYDTGGSGSARLTNVSARSAVSTGAGVLIVGFFVNENTRAVLVRGVGPTLNTAFGLGDALANPQLKVFQSGQIIAENNDWSQSSNASAVASAASSVGAFALPASGSQDAAVLLTLPPGSYTAQVSGVNNTTGVALVEVYEVP